MTRILVGGTFDRLHSGHRKLIKTAFAHGDLVIIALCSDKMVRNKPSSVYIEPYKIRRDGVIKFAKGLGKSFEIIEINDPYEPAASMKDLDGIVVSTETIQNALIINMMRKERGLPPLRIIAIPLVRDMFGNVISSRKIREKLEKIYKKNKKNKKYTIDIDNL